MKKYSSVIEQYLQIKEKHKDCIVFFRLGEFYEMFFEDAKTAAHSLDLSLTKRHNVPACGIPHYSAHIHIYKLVMAGHKVAICEQIEQEKIKRKGDIINRQVVRIITPGTIISEDYQNRYIAYVMHYKEQAQAQAYAMAYCDVATGEFYVFSSANLNSFLDEVQKLNIKEIVYFPSFEISILDTILKSINFIPTKYDICYNYKTAKSIILNHFNIHNLESFGDIQKAEYCAAAALLSYLIYTQKHELAQITGIATHAYYGYMVLDKIAYKNLELTESLREGKLEGSLLWVLDNTKTPMGSRMLKAWLAKPLLNIDDIIARQQAIAEFKIDTAGRESLMQALNQVCDMERTCAKLSEKSIRHKEVLDLKNSIQALSKIKETLKKYKSVLNIYFSNELDDLSDIYELIATSVNEQQESTASKIASGHNLTLDAKISEYNELLKSLNILEQKESKKLNIKNLEIKYNKSIGYYIEIANSKVKALPQEYIIRQTMVSNTKITTNEIKEVADQIVISRFEIENLEKNIFSQICSTLLSQITRIKEAAHMLSFIDALCSLANVAHNHNYTAPKINNEEVIDIKNGRHPVIEKIQSGFVANSTYLDGGKEKVAIVTGPNMSGKSTYLRQSALITVMAQIGSFVPAESAIISVCDRVFTRIGAHDDLLKGQSTFMVEMSEVASILTNATRDSLIILDEVGRGTSTSDGLALAVSIIEYLANKISAKILCATHYKELTEIEGNIPGVVNYCAQVEEIDGKITFLRSIVKGTAKNSYGIYVAKIAGVPLDVIVRSIEIQRRLEVSNIYENYNKIMVDEENLSSINKKGDDYKLFLEEIGNMDTDFKPSQELANKLIELKTTAKNRLIYFNISKK